MNNMMDQLIGNTGCSLDSSVNNNPLAIFANAVLDGQLGNVGIEGNVDMTFVGEAPNREESFQVSHLSETPAFSYSSYASLDTQMECIWEKSSGASVNYSSQLTSSEMAASMLFGGYRSSLSPSASHQGTGIHDNRMITPTSQINDMDSMSIDQLLAESMRSGQVTKEELAIIHRVIGFDSKISLKNQENIDKITQVMNMNKESSLKESMKPSEQPSVEGYNRAWTKLAERLESLDDLKAPIVTTKPEANPFMQAGGSSTASALSSQNLMMHADSVLSIQGSDIDLNTADGLLHLSQKLFESGDIRNAVLASEADVLKFPEHSEGWCQLGLCYAENEDDKKALQCLKKAVQLDPYNLTAQLALGTSYVNEMNSNGAVQALKCWVTHNPEFQDIQVKLDDYSDGTVLDDAMQLMLSALAQTPNNPDIHVVLGILYNVSLDYKSAAEHFEKALDARPRDYGLLNKLGATLANNNQSIEATEYYARALEIRPKYTRAWVNLGIAYFNMGDGIVCPGALHEACKAFAQALVLAPDAQHVWGYLRMALSAINELELIELTSKENAEAACILVKELEKLEPRSK